jgi:hypothetical protein
MKVVEKLKHPVCAHSALGINVALFKTLVQSRHISINFLICFAGQGRGGDYMLVSWKRAVGLIVPSIDVLTFPYH